LGIGATLSGLAHLVWRILDGIRKALHLALLLIIFGFLLALLHDKLPVLPATAALVIAPEGALVEQLSTDAVRRAIGQASGGPAPETLLPDVLDAIAAAKDDPRIKLIVLDTGSLDASGLSKLQEVGAALREFRSSGKRVVAVGDAFDQGQYYLAAQASEVYLDPLGLVYLDGFSYYRMFLKGAVEKLGVDVNVFKVGTYKSFTDQFSRSDMAPTEREETSVWLGALWNAYQQDVTRARSLPTRAITDYVTEAPAALAVVKGDAAKLALQRGLVTALKSRRQVSDDLKALVGEDSSTHSFNQVPMNAYLQVMRAKKKFKSGSDAHVGIVVAAGDIMDGHQAPGNIGGDSTSDLLREARYDKSIKAVVLRVDSPGGSMFASEQILREVQALRKSGKPVVVSMSTYAASGGYYIAAAANQIYASPTTITGSIGVFAVIPTFQRTLEKIGVTVDGVGTTPMAGDLRLDRPIGEASRQVLQAGVEHAYAQFLQRVSDGRKKSVEEVDKIAQGRVWAGVDAQRLGLVDHLGGLKDATDAAAKLADLGNDYDTEYLQQDLSLREELLTQLRSEGGRLAVRAGLVPSTPLTRALDPLLGEAAKIAALKDPRGLFSYCWCTEPGSALRGLTSPR
jgi:protease IV